jgi:hypothetical protein
MHEIIAKGTKSRDRGRGRTSLPAPSAARPPSRPSRRRRRRLLRRQPRLFRRRPAPAAPSPSPTGLPRRLTRRVLLRLAVLAQKGPQRRQVVLTEAQRVERPEHVVAADGFALLGLALFARPVVVVFVVFGLVFVLVFGFFLVGWFRVVFLLWGWLWGAGSGLEDAREKEGEGEASERSSSSPSRAKRAEQRPGAREENKKHTHSLVTNETNSLTHSCTASLASLAILALGGSAFFMMRAMLATGR